MFKPLDEQGLADYLGVSHEWVRAKVKACEIPFTRLPGGRLVRFTEDDVAAILDAGKQPALNGPLAAPHLSVARRGHPPAGPSTPPPPPGPPRREKVA